MKRSIFRLAIGVSSLCAGLAYAYGTPEEVPIFITIGQSNADGSAMFDSEEDTRLLTWYSTEANNGNLKIWYRSTQVANQSTNSLGEAARWVVDGTTVDVQPRWLDLWYRNENLQGRTAMNMIHGYGTYSTGSGTDCAQGRRGMEGQFGMRFAQAFPNKELYIIKLGVSGSFISSWANPIDNHNWDYFYEYMFKPAIADLISRGKRPRLAGIWWMQGCADSDKSQTYYEQQLRTLIEKCRRELGFNNGKFYIGHIMAPGENAAYPNGSVSYSDAVRNAQDALAADINEVETIDTRNCSMQYESAFSGYIHFDHKGVNAIGDLLADKVIANGPDSWAQYSTPGTWTRSGESAIFTPAIGNPQITYSTESNVVTATLTYSNWSETKTYTITAAGSSSPGHSTTGSGLTIESPTSGTISENTFSTNDNTTGSEAFVRDTAPSKVLVFGMNEDGSKYCRIPALVTAADGSLVALADKRGESLSDLPNTISVVAKRSTDGGETWSNAVTIAQGDSNTGKTYGDPAVVLDRNTGKLIAVFSGDTGFFVSTKTNRAGFYISTSSDNGVTWTKPRAITDQIYQSSWYGAFCASGSMLQTESGRIMFVANTRLNSAQYVTDVYEFVCASDDGGETWTVLNPDTRIPSDGQGNESKLVELSDGSLIMSIRSNNKRRFSKSTDGGMTWSEATSVNELPEPSCNGDIIVYPSTDGQTRMLHSLPANSTIRRDVSVFLSYDEGTTWPLCKKLVDDYSAYSSLTVLPDGSIGCFVEEGKWDSDIEGEDGFCLYFMKFTLDWLTDGKDIPKTRF